MASTHDHESSQRMVDCHGEIRNRISACTRINEKLKTLDTPPKAFSDFFKGPDPNPYRDLLEVERSILECEYFPGRKNRRQLTTIINRNSTNPVVGLRAHYALAKVLRFRYFDLVAALSVLIEAEKAISQYDGLFKNASGHRFYDETVWRINHEKAWNHIYLKQYHRAEQILETGLELPYPDKDYVTVGTNIAKAFMLFVQAYDDPYRDFTKAENALRNCAAQTSGTLADHCMLYVHSCRLFSLAPPPDAALGREFLDLTRSEFPIVRYYAHLCSAASFAIAGMIEESKRQIEIFGKYREPDLEAICGHTLQVNSVPWFYLLEQELVAATSPDSIETCIRAVRERAEAPIKGLESLQALEYRISFAPQVYAFYRVLVQLYLFKMRHTGVTQEDLQRTTLYIEKSRKAAIDTWYGSHRIHCDETEALPVTEEPVKAINPLSETPVKDLVRYSRSHEDALFIFCTEFTLKPVLIYYQKGQATLFESQAAPNVVTNFIKKILTREQFSDTHQVYLFGDPALYRNHIDLAARLETKLGHPVSLYYVNDLIRFSRKLKLVERKPCGCLALYNTYVTKKDALDSQNAREHISGYCKKRSIPYQAFDTAGLSGVQELLDLLAMNDIIFIFAHGEYSDDCLSQYIRFSKFSLTINDLFLRKNLFKGKYVCLCCCSSGRDHQRVGHESISIANVISAQGAKLVYAPIEKFYARDFEIRVREFCEIVDGKVVGYPENWRVVV